jgi:hypothetical protein
MTGRRNHTGHRIGPWHGRAKWPTETVERARSLRERGKVYKAIGAELGVPWRTVADWCRRDTRWAG